MPEKITRGTSLSPFDAFESKEQEGRSMAPPKFSLSASPLATGNPIQKQDDEERRYTVQPGDGPERIAAKFGITVAALYQANGFKESEAPGESGQGIFIVIKTGKRKMLDPGDVLIIPKAGKGEGGGSGKVALGESAMHGAATSSLSFKGARIPEGLPPGYPQPKMNISRHVVAQSNFGMAKAAGNSMLLNPIAEAEFSSLYREAAWSGVLDGEVKLSNGQTWRIIKAEGKFFPVSGPGIIQLTSAEVNVLAAFRSAALEGGSEAATNALQKQLVGRGMKVSPGLKQALEVVAAKYNIPAGQIVKAIAPSLASETATPASLVEEAKVVSKGRAFKVIKFGGRLLLIVAVAADVYELYQADFAAKQVVTTAGGWAGSLGAGAVAAESASPLLAGGPWGWLGYGVIVIGAGAVGYFVGSETAETIYEYGWEKQ